MIRRRNLHVFALCFLKELQLRNLTKKEVQGSKTKVRDHGAIFLQTVLKTVCTQKDFNVLDLVRLPLPSGILSPLKIT